MNAGPPRGQDVAFESLRPRLFGLAYRMTGSVADAEDLCSEAWLRWQAVDHAGVRSPEAFLVTLTTRLALDLLRSAPRRRESYVGPWLPEPLPTRGEAAGSGAPPGRDPAATVELADSLTFGFLTMLDALSPRERAVLLLHDVFGYDFTSTARTVGTTPAAARTAASRARRKLRAAVEAAPTAGSAPSAIPAVAVRTHGADTGVTTSPDATREKLWELAAHLAAGDSDAVLAVLAPGVVEVTDGGSTVRAARRAVVGAPRVARLLVNTVRRLATDAPEVEEAELNGAPALVISIRGRVHSTMSIELDGDGLIARIWLQMNPAKLAHLGHP